MSKRINNLETVTYGIGLEIFGAKLRKAKLENRREKQLGDYVKS